MRERERLIGRIRQLRRAADAGSGGPVAESDREYSGAQPLETRIAHLEQLLEGFQDSVHRESERQDARITELEMQIQPAALGVALSEHALRRGL